MKLVVAGSRYLTKQDIVIKELDKIHSSQGIDEVVCGEAPGADMIGKYWALKNNVPIKSYIAECNIYGKAAEPIRNEEMANYADEGIVFLLNTRENIGSKNMIGQLSKYGKNVKIISIEEE